MKIALEIFMSLFILVLSIAICIGLISSDVNVNEARDCYYSCINELQASNFADNVAHACVTEANNKGYSLHIDIYQDSNGDRSASIILEYKYRITPLGISQNKTIEGFID